MTHPVKVSFSVEYETVGHHRPDERLRSLGYRDHDYIDIVEDQNRPFVCIITMSDGSEVEGEIEGWTEYGDGDSGITVTFNKQ